jgi:predicted CXXCH cytochrome family protein
MLRRIARKHSILILILISCLIFTSAAYGKSVVDSRHNLSWVWAQSAFHQDYGLNNYGEVCVYCHTPHSANSGIDAPLWNRNTPTASYTVYSSSTMDTSPGQPSGISLACLSCHDGTIAVDEIINAPGSGANTYDLPGTQWYHGEPSRSDTAGHGKMSLGKMSDDNCGGCHGTGMFGAHIASASYLTTDLSDDHPISMPIPDSVDDPDFNTPTEIVNAGLKLFGSTDTVECSSCHNVHDPEIEPFLRKDNAGSDLCSTCHTK